MKITNWLTLAPYFAQFKGQFGIEDYVFGTTDDILNRKNKVIRYPCLWLEFLGERVDDNDNSHYDIRLTIQQNGGNQPREKDWTILYQLRQTLERILKTMRGDSPNNLVFYKFNAKYDYKERFAGDDELLVSTEIAIGALKTCTDS